MQKFKGFLALLSCAVIFGTFSIMIRLLGNDLQTYQQIGFRNVFGLIISLIVVIATKQSFSSFKKISPKYLVLYTLSFPLAVIFFTLAVFQVKIVTTIFGLYAGSLITSLIIGTLAFKEKFNPMKVLSLALVSVGFLAYAYPFEGTIFSTGFCFALLSGFFDATANAYRKYLAGKVDRFVLVVLQMVGGIVIASLLMLAFNQFSFPALSPTTWVVGIIFGACLVAISYLTLIGFQNFDLNLGTVVLSSEIFFGSLFAYLFFQEKALFNELLGGVLIITATVIANFSIEKESRIQRVVNKISTFFGKSALQR